MRIDESQLETFFRNKSVIVLGSAPNVVTTDADFMNNFDLICRVNNYRFFNGNHRVDIYYSFLGKSIRKQAHELNKDKCKLIMCKCPENAVEVKNSDGTINQKLTDDYQWIYDFRIPWLEHTHLNYFIQTGENFTENNLMVGQIMSTGVAAIMDILRCKPSKLCVAGFDFGQSGKHNITQNMIIKPDPNCHHWQDEYNLIKKLFVDGVIDCSDAIIESFNKDFRLQNCG